METLRLLRLAAPFCQKSLSEETRRAYRRAIKEFFLFVKGIHPSQTTPAHVLRRRDCLKEDGRKSATISFKLTVVRSFFESLRADGCVHFNPASTKLVTPPVVSDETHSFSAVRMKIDYNTRR
jgi:site-specific recombinase XerD